MSYFINLNRFGNTFTCVACASGFRKIPVLRLCYVGLEVEDGSKIPFSTEVEAAQKLGFSVRVGRAVGRAGGLGISNWKGM